MWTRGKAQPGASFCRFVDNCRALFVNNYQSSGQFFLRGKCKRKNISISADGATSLWPTISVVVCCPACLDEL